MIEGFETYLDGRLHENGGGIIHTFGPQVQHGRVTLLRGAGQSLVDLSLSLDQRGMDETSVKDARPFGGRTQ